MRGITVGVLFGIVLGAGGAWLDTVFDFSYDQVTVRTLIVGGAWFLLNSGVVWGLLAFVAGRLAQRARFGAIAGVVSLVAAVSAYYLYATTLGDRIWGIGPLLPVISRWMLAAVTLGALLGFLGWLSRRRGVVAYLGIATPLVLSIGAFAVGVNTYNGSPITVAANVFVILACGLAGAVMVVRRRRIHGAVVDDSQFA